MGGAARPVAIVGGDDSTDGVAPVQSVGIVDDSVGVELIGNDRKLSSGAMLGEIARQAGGVCGVGLASGTIAIEVAEKDKAITSQSTTTSDIVASQREPIASGLGIGAGAAMNLNVSPRGRQGENTRRGRVKRRRLGRGFIEWGVERSAGSGGAQGKS